ncbi:hypothetical protein B0H34DRAFT_686757 [Crassisporium funariophilum]|nr:hypothetical protein B0H34DRAFT_686757 [Crassisporium funariophilum]
MVDYRMPHHRPPPDLSHSPIAIDSAFDDGSRTRRDPPLKRRQTSTLTLHERQLHRRLSPFLSLPVELHVEIFSHCIPPFPRFDIREGPLLIARVCYAWRSLVLSTPRLWSSFAIEIQGSGTSVSLQDMYIVSTVKLWLERSRNYPLSIRVIHVPYGRIPDERSAQLLAVLIPEARRWRHVQLIIPAANMATLQTCLPDGFPLLQTLTLQMRGLWGSEPALNISSMKIPWHQLTALDLQLEQIHMLTLDGGLDILGQAVNLLECTLNVHCSLDRRRIHGGTMLLPKLEMLHLILHGGSSNNITNATGVLTDRPEACLTQFLNLLSVPKLRVLRLGWLVPGNGSQRSWSPTHSDFIAFLRRLAPTLQTLSLTYLPMGEAELIECLSQVPQVRHLELRFSLNDRGNDPIADRFLAGCTLPSVTPSATVGKRRRVQSESCLVPLLEDISLQCHGELLTRHALLAFVDSRWLGGSGGPGMRTKLKSFHLLTMHPVSKEVEKRVRSWTIEGLDISIECLVIR